MSMGVDTVVWVNKLYVEKLLFSCDNFLCWDDYLFLRDISGIRWDTFHELLKIEDSEVIYDDRVITSKKLLKHIATYQGKIKDRMKWVDICMNYDLLFTPDTYENTEEIEKDYIPLWKINTVIEKTILDNKHEILKRILSEEEVKNETRTN